MRLDTAVMLLCRNFRDIFITLQLHLSIAEMCGLLLISCDHVTGASEGTTKLVLACEVTLPRPVLWVRTLIDTVSANTMSTHFRVLLIICLYPVYGKNLRAP